MSFLSHASSGRWIEVLHLVGPRIVEHVVVPPNSRAIVAGVMVSDRLFTQGETSVVSVASLEGHGELLVRFVQSPSRLLPTDPSRLALVLLLVAACLSSMGAHRTVEPLSAPGVTQLDRVDATSRARRRHAHRREARERLRAPTRRRHAAHARIRRVVRAVRVMRFMRRVVALRTAPEPDPDADDPDPDLSISSRPLPEPRARGPPATTCTRSCTPLTSNLVTWRKTCSWFNCS